MAIFNPENSIWRVTGKLVDLMILSVFWLACSLPVVTLGPASAALYHTVVQCIRGNRRDSWTLFFRTFRDNLKVGVLTTLVVLAVGAALLFLHGLAYQMAAAGTAESVFYLCYTLRPAGHCSPALHPGHGPGALPGPGTAPAHPLHRPGPVSRPHRPVPFLFPGAHLRPLHPHPAGIGGRG